MTEEEYRQYTQKRIYDNPSLFINSHVFAYLILGKVSSVQ